MRNARALGRSPTDPLVTPPSLVITPTLESVISVDGFAQLGWLNRLLVVISHRILKRSPQAKSLCRPAAKMTTPGPLMTPLPEVPNWPSVGGAKASGLNHCSTVCGPLLGLLRMFGRSWTLAGSLVV